MKEARELINQVQNPAPGNSLQPREVIQMNAQIREAMRQLQDDVEELHRLHQKESKKRRVSKACFGLLFIPPPPPPPPPFSPFFFISFFF